MSADMGYWSQIVAPKQPAIFEVEQTPQTTQYIHLTNVALGPDATMKGEVGAKHCLTLSMGGGPEVALATLDSKAHPQHHVDVVIDQTVIFK